MMSCGGEGCGARDPWPLHHVRHRGVLWRLCTSCVLKYHPGSFCTLCFDLLDGTANAVIHCARCPASVHTACLSLTPNAVEFVCPPCATGPDPATYSYFALESDQDGRRRLDPSSAKILLAAAQLAASSMNRAAAATRADAERKVREAAVAKKRAREMLEGVIVLSNNCKNEHQQPPQPVKVEVKVEAEAEAKKYRPQSTSQSREREKLMRCVGPIRNNQPNSSVNNFRQDGEKNGKAMVSQQSQGEQMS